MESFRGTQIHSSQFRSARGLAGKQAVVVGSDNSAHDICADLWEHGADVTMIQRSPTLVARSDTLMDLALGALYSEAAIKNGITADMADLILASLPYKVLPALQVPVYQQMKERDAAFYKRLEQSGFMLTFGEDDSGLLVMYLRRGSGYYVDVGASELIADGRVKLMTGEIDRVTATGVEMKNGMALTADLIVYATGYSSMNGSVAQLVSQEVAEKVGQCWGLGSGTSEGSRTVGRRVAQHVEADPAAESLVPRRQPSAVAPLLAVPVAAVEGTDGRNPDAGVRPRAGDDTSRTIGGKPTCRYAVSSLHNAPHHGAFTCATADVRTAP